MSAISKICIFIILGKLILIYQNRKHRIYKSMLCLMVSNFLFSFVLFSPLIFSKLKMCRNDCGVFIAKYMECYCTRNPKSCAFSAEDIPDFRVQIALDTVYNDYNSETEQMDFLSTFDLEVIKY
jgi:hypothetical protein